MTRDKRWQAKFSGFVSWWKQFLSLKNCRSVRICSVLNRSNRDTTVYYRLIFCAFSWPNMVKWRNSGIIKIVIYLNHFGFDRLDINFNPLTAEWALRALTDFTLSNARLFYSSMGNPLAVKGLTRELVKELNKLDGRAYFELSWSVFEQTEWYETTY